MLGIYKLKGLQDSDAKKQMYRNQRTAFKRTSDTFDIKNTTFVSIVSLYGTMGNITNSICNVWINLKRNKEVQELFIKLLPTFLYKMFKSQTSNTNTVFISSFGKSQRTV
uniref:Uncharacterized protein n=1 Tax=Acrobeloides nanus TaxID=290746 RepID=A0A914E5D4_9BILA